MALIVTGSIISVEHSKSWWSFNLRVGGALTKIIVESEDTPPFKVGDEIVAAAKRVVPTDRGLKLFTTLDLVTMSDG